MIPDNSVPRWYAAYTRSHHEKTTAEHLTQRSIEHFVPTYDSVRMWKDRKKRLELPLFPGYVFVRMLLDEKRSVLVVPGVVRLVGFDNHPLAVPDDEIETLRSVVAHKLKIEPHPFLVAGRRVRILRGALEGMQGILVRRKGRLRMLLSIELIRRTAMIEVDAQDVEPIPEARSRFSSSRSIAEFAGTSR
jgi:transcription antitermination factor NusG